MPDSWNFSQRPKRQATTAAAGPPITTYLLAAICIVVTLAESFPDPSFGPFWHTLGSAFLPNGQDIWTGKYYELITGIFPHEDLVHGSLGFTHLLFNMWWFVTIAGVIEMTAGPAVLLTLVFTSAAVSSGAQILWDGPGIGMSGVLYALFGVMWASKGHYPEWDKIATRNNMLYFLMWGVFCIIATYTNLLSVANGAHFGGLIFGLAVGYVFFAPRRRPAWIAVLVLSVVVVVLSVTYVPWNPLWQELHGGGPQSGG